MDKRSSKESTKARTRQAGKLKPITILADNSRGDEFNDASRDPRLTNDKYRAQIMYKSRISPDTTNSSIQMPSMKTKVKTEPGAMSTCRFCPSPAPIVSKDLDDHIFLQHEKARFGCGLCGNEEGSAKFDTIEEIRDHIGKIHSIANDIVDKLIRLPITAHLRSYRCVACSPKSRDYIGISEDKLRAHFKLKHKTNNIKPFLLKRICRICANDTSGSDAELVKHIDAAHPRSNYWVDEDDDEVDDADDANVASEKEEEEEEEEDVLAPELIISVQEHSSIPEDGEILNEEPPHKSAKATVKIEKKRQRKASSSSSTSSSSGSQTKAATKKSKSKPKPKQYDDNSSSSNNDSDDDSDSNNDKRQRIRAALSKERRSQSPKKVVEDKRRVFIATTNGSNAVEQSLEKKMVVTRQTGESTYFGISYVPPSGFCEECDFRYESGTRAQDHFNSRNHFFNVKNKFRCYFCNQYVQDTKAHLESRHRDMTFQCLCQGCNQPRFTQARKIIDHIKCNHPMDYRNARDVDDLFRRKLMSLPKSLASYACRDCNVMFHGDLKIVIVHMVLEHGHNIPEKHHIRFTCRLCGSNGQFKDEKDLDRHCKSHYRNALTDSSRSRSPESSGSESASPIRRSRRRSRSTSGGSSGGDDRKRRRSGSYKHPARGRPGSSDRSTTHSPVKQQALSCHYCKDQFRTVSVRKQHMLRSHKTLLFQCELCTFVNMFKRDVLWHLREHHGREKFNDEVLMRNYVRWPKDMRKIVCIRCSDHEALEHALWLCRDPNEITRELKEHAELKHGLFGAEVDRCYSLQCSGCQEKYHLDGELRDWDDHLDNCHNRSHHSHQPQHHHHQQAHQRYQQHSPAAPVSNNSNRASSPVIIDPEKQCSYCCKQLETRSKIEEHIRNRHLDVTFVCKLCDSGEHHYEPDLRSMKHHLRDKHDKTGDSSEYIRYPTNLQCIKCNMCGLMFHAQKISDLELHFNLAHPDCDFSDGHLDYLCRLCMSTGQNDTMDELRQHLEDEHPEELK